MQLTATNAPLRAVFRPAMTGAEVTEGGMAEARVTFDNAQAYEDFMGRWSRAIGEKFLAWLDPPNNARWLDLGCGTGAFTGLILKTCAPAKVAGIDPSPQQVEHAQAHFPQAEFRVGDSMALPFGDAEFDAV